MNKYLLELYLDYLNQHESYSQSMVKRNRTQKTKSSAGVIANSLAKKQNDPAYRKMLLYKKLYKQNKAVIQRKYKSRSMALARQKASKY